MNWLKTLLLKIAGIAKIAADWILSESGRSVLDWAIRILPVVIEALRAERNPDSAPWRDVALFHLRKSLNRSNEQTPAKFDSAAVRRAAVTADLPDGPWQESTLRAAMEIAYQIHTNPAK